MPSPAEGNSQEGVGSASRGSPRQRMEGVPLNNDQASPSAGTGYPGLVAASISEISPTGTSIKIALPDDRNVELRLEVERWVVVGEHQAHRERVFDTLSDLDRSNPGQPALLMYALTGMGEPKRELHELKPLEGAGIRSAIDGYLEIHALDTDPKNDQVRAASSALHSAMQTDQYKAAVEAQISAERTKGLAHPLLGDAVLKLRVGGKTNFTFEFIDGKIAGLDELSPADRYLRLRAVEHCMVLPEDQKQHLLGELRPKVTVDSEGAFLISMAVGKPEELSNHYRSENVRAGAVRYSQKGEKLTVRQGDVGEWSPAVGLVLK